MRHQTGSHIPHLKWQKTHHAMCSLPHIDYKTTPNYNTKYQTQWDEIYALSDEELKAKFPTLKEDFERIERHYAAQKAAWV